MITIIEKANNFFKNYLNIPITKKILPKNEKKALFKIKDDDSFYLVFGKGRIEVKKIEVDENNIKKTFDLVLESDKKTIGEIFNSNLTPAEAYQNKKLYFRGIPYKEYPWLTHFIRVLQTKKYKG